MYNAHYLALQLDCKYVGGTLFWLAIGQFNSNSFKSTCSDGTKFAPIIFSEKYKLGSRAAAVPQISGRLFPEF